MWRVDRWTGWTVLGSEHPGATALGAIIVGATLISSGRPSPRCWSWSSSLAIILAVLNPGA